MKMLSYKCPKCKELDLLEPQTMGSEAACKGCQSSFIVPVKRQSELIEVIDDWDDDEEDEPKPKQKQKTTTMRMALPKGLGSMETKVTQRTADGMAQTFLGGLLALAGVFVAVFLGRRGRGA